MSPSQGSLGSSKYSLKCLHVLRLTDVMHRCSFARARCLLIALIIFSAWRISSNYAVLVWKQFAGPICISPRMPEIFNVAIHLEYS